ncbi:MAG: hypothetical protein JOY93_02215 [Acidobacteriales bacterium]|nr:hypothetical protein [Terriglobales bacterium]
MRKLSRTLLPVLAIATVLGLASMSMAQSCQAPENDENSAYMLAYYSNANFQAAKAPLGELRLANDGDNQFSCPQGGECISGGIISPTLYADLYVFDNSQELQDCCSCPITADGIISEDVNSELLYRPVTGFVNHFGLIKIISSSTGPDATQPTPTPGIRGWETHIQALGQFAKAPLFGTDSVSLNNYAIPQGPFAVTETQVQDANLSFAEEVTLTTLCKYALILGSGRGQCKCTPEDFTF